MKTAHHTNVFKTFSTAAVLLAVLWMFPAPCSALQSSKSAPHGAYLGCFDPSKLFMDDAVKVRSSTKHGAADCWQGMHKTYTVL
jgi:hypothetical protein